MIEVSLAEAGWLKLENCGVVRSLEWSPVAESADICHGVAGFAADTGSRFDLTTAVLTSQISHVKNLRQLLNESQ